MFVVPLGNWFVALGEESSRLLRWKVGDPQIAVHHLPRISFEGSYDPGGFFRAQFFPVASARVLVATEESIALVHRDQSVRGARAEAQVRRALELDAPLLRPGGAVSMNPRSQVRPCNLAGCEIDASP